MSRSTIPRSARVKNCCARSRRNGRAVVGIYGNLMTRRNVVAIAEAARARMPRGDRRAGAGQLCRRISERGRGCDRERRRRSVAGSAAARRRIGRGVPGIQYRAGDGSVAQNARRAADCGSGRAAVARSRADRYPSISCAPGASGTGADRFRVITARGCPYHCRWCSHSVYRENASAAIGGSGG